MKINNLESGYFDSLQVANIESSRSISCDTGPISNYTEVFKCSADIAATAGLSGTYTSTGKIESAAGGGGGSSLMRLRLSNSYALDNLSLKTDIYDNGMIYCHQVHASSGQLTSDDRIKVNERPITGALTTLKKLVPLPYYKTVRFHTDNELPDDATYESGFVAQQIREIPELSHCVSGQEFDDDGNPTSLYMNYTNLIAFLTKGVQELSTKNDALEARIAALEKTLTQNMLS